MKLYRNLLLSASALLCMAGFASCDDEDNTLEGANNVYIEMNPTDYTLRLGDTIRISARVSNESGHDIDTPIEWSVDDESVARLFTDSLDVKYIVAVDGGQNRATKLRATLKNGKYGVANVQVVNNNVAMVAVLDELGVAVPHHTSYDIGHDSVVFTVRPRQLLYDFEPTYEIEGEGLTVYERQPLYIDREAGTVAIHYAAGRKFGEGKISMSIGEDGDAGTGSIVIRMDPPIEGSSFFGADYSNNPAISTNRPPLHTLSMWYNTSYERMMDINKVDTCRVAVNVQTGDIIDIKEALNCYRWETIEGNSVMVSAMYEEVVEKNGFDAILVVRSGITEGETSFRFVTPVDTLVAVYNVYNYKENYPVDEIICDPMEVELASGEIKLITTSVVPMSSFGFHRPVVTAADPEIVSVGEYISNQVPLTGLKAGDTYLTLTSNDKTLTVPVHVREGVSNIMWEKNNETIFFEGQTVEWGVNVVTPSGAPNPYPVEWLSSDNEIVKGAAHASDLTKGLVTGVKAGQASIRAKVLNLTSDEMKVTVVAAPSDFSMTAEEYIGVIVDPDELVLDVTPGAELPYSQIMIRLRGIDGSAGTGTFTPGEGSVAEFDNAVAAITGGTLTVAEDGTLNGALKINIPGKGEITLSFNNTPAELW